MKRITSRPGDPIEGHAKITIHLDDNGRRDGNRIPRDANSRF